MNVNFDDGAEEFSVDLQRRRFRYASFEGKNYLGAIPELLDEWMAYVKSPWTAIFTCRPTVFSLGYVKIPNGPKHRFWVPGTRLNCAGLLSDRVDYSPNNYQFTAYVLTYNPSSGDTELVIDAIRPAFLSTDTTPALTMWSARGVGTNDMLSAGGNLAVASGGTGSSLIRSPHAARENLGLSSPLLTTAEVFEDFLEYTNPDLTTAGFPWRINKAGSGAILTDDMPASLAGSTFFAGIATLRTQGINDYIQIDRLDASRGGATLANNNFEFLARINIESLADVTNDYQLQIGYGGYQGSVGVDQYGYSGFGFEYNRSQSANWRCKIANIGTITTQTTGTAVSTGWVVLGISKTGTTMTFTINGTSVYTPTSGYPVFNAQTNMSNLSVLFRRTAGSATARNVYLDYLWNRHIATGR